MVHADGSVLMVFKSRRYKPDGTHSGMMLGLARAPHSVMAINRKALIGDHLGDRVQGLALLREAARLAPNDDHAKYNIGLYHLKYGDYAAGWDGYERRRAFESYVNKHRRIPLPEWDGGAAGTLLVLPEQGLAVRQYGVINAGCFDASNSVGSKNARSSPALIVGWM